MQQPSPFEQIKEQEETRMQVGIAKSAPELKRSEYQASLLFKVTRAPTPEQAAEVLKGELVKIVHMLKEYWGRIAGYHGALAVDVPMFPILPMTERKYVGLADVKEIRLSTEKQQQELEHLVYEARNAVTEMEKARRGTPLHYHEMAAMCDKPLAFAEKKENEKLLLRLLVAGGSSRKQYASSPAIRKFAILEKAFRVLGGK